MSVVPESRYRIPVYPDYILKSMVCYSPCYKHASVDKGHTLPPLLDLSLQVCLLEHETQRL
jgi:hypothetical protein